MDGLNITRGELTTLLDESKRLINFARQIGMTDQDIIRMLQLNPKNLGKDTVRLLKLIKSGKVDLDKDTLEDIAERMYEARCKKGRVHYHLKQLIKYGYL